MGRLVNDVRYAVRRLRNSPGFALTAVVTLALGIGANTAIFTLVEGILLRSLPVTDPARLYRIGDTDDCCVEGGFVGDNGDFDIFSYDLYQHLRSSAPEFEELAAVQAGQGQWSVRRGQELPRELKGEFVSGNYFSTLGLGASAGRVFTGADDTPSAPPAAVVSYRAWQNEFGADPSLVGSTIFLEAHPYTVVGIAPEGFFGDRISDAPPDLWTPLSTEPYMREAGSILHHEASNWLYPVGRVRPGTSPRALEAKLSAALRGWLSGRPAYTDNGGAAIIPRQHVVVVPAGGGIQSLQQETGRGLRMLMILSTVVLLIACANIANLILARSTARHSEIAVRMAMGADRVRVIRQILTESVILSILGGLAGLVVAYAGSHTILALAFPDARSLPIDARPSLPVLGFAFAVSLIVGVLFGLAPAWISSRARPAEVLRGANRATRDRTSLPQRALVVLQAALSLVLIAGATLMTRSLVNLEHQNFGIATANRYVMHLDTAGAGYGVERLAGLYRRIEDGLTRIPGVTGVGMALYSPLEGDNWGECVIQQGHPAPGPNSRCGATWDRVSPRFLDAVGVPILRGRGLGDADTATATPVAVVNQTFAQRFFPGQDPVGRHFGIGFVPYSGAFEIVGVFADFKMNNPREAPRPVYLRPLAQRFMGYREPDMVATELQSMYADAIVVSLSRPQPNVTALLRRTMNSIDPALTVVDIRSLDAQVAGNFNQDRLIARLTTLFGALALVLACVGLYGVTAYLVARRAGEIGIRMALGATRAGVVRMVLGGVLLEIGLGLLVGIPAALGAGHLMATQLYGVGAYDAIALLVATGSLGLCAALAGFLPARRAASIEPMQALRTE